MLPGCLLFWDEDAKHDDIFRNIGRAILNPLQTLRELWTQ